MTAPTTATVARALAYIAITGGKTGLHVNTRIALYPYVDFVEYEVDYGSFKMTAHRDQLNDAGRALAETSKLWKAHAALTAQGFKLRTGARRQKPGFLSYDHPTERNRGDARGAFISSGTAYAQDPEGSEAREGSQVWAYHVVAV